MGTIPERNARPQPVELDQVFNIFNKPTRAGIQQSLTGFGNALAGRGPDLNRSIAAFRPLVDHLLPVARNLSSPQTQLARFFRSLEAAASEVAPVAEQQAALFRNLDKTFAALAPVARPYIQQFISGSPPTEDTAIREFPRQRPFLRNTAALFHELRPGVAVLPHALPILADAEQVGARTLARTPALNTRLKGVFRALDRFVSDPLVPRGVKRLDETVKTLQPLLDYFNPAQALMGTGSVSKRRQHGTASCTWTRFRTSSGKR